MVGALVVGAGGVVAGAGAVVVGAGGAVVGAGGAVVVAGGACVGLFAINMKKNCQDYYKTSFLIIKVT